MSNVEDSTSYGEMDDAGSEQESGSGTASGEQVTSAPAGDPGDDSMDDQAADESYHRSVADHEMGELD